MPNRAVFCMLSRKAEQGYPSGLILAGTDTEEKSSEYFLSPESLFIPGSLMDSVNLVLDPPGWICAPLFEEGIFLGE